MKNTIAISGKTITVTFAKTGAVRTVESETYSEMRQTLAEIIARFGGKVLVLDT